MGTNTVALLLTRSLALSLSGLCFPRCSNWGAFLWGTFFPTVPFAGGKDGYGFSGPGFILLVGNFPLTSHRPPHGLCV